MALEESGETWVLTPQVHRARMASESPGMRGAHTAGPFVRFLSGMVAFPLSVPGFSGKATMLPPDTLPEGLPKRGLAPIDTGFLERNSVIVHGEAPNKHGLARDENTAQISCRPQCAPCTNLDGDDATKRS